MSATLTGKVYVRRIHQELRRMVCEVPAGYSKPGSIHTPREAFEILQFMQTLTTEQVWAIYVDGRHRLLALCHVSSGTATASLIHPREVLGPAVRLGAVGVILAHNHPSGSPEPSAEDRGVTVRMLAACELLGITLLDHIVIGDGAFVSIRGRGGFLPSA